MKGKEGEKGMVPDVREETGADAADEGYARYRALGGNFDIGTYQGAVERARDFATRLDQLKQAQEEDSATPASRELQELMRRMRDAEYYAGIAGITLRNSEDGLDPRMLYAILRQDKQPAGVQHHHEQMGDQKLLGHALRIVGDAEGLEKLKAKHSQDPSF